jgi:hypothetical protein
MKKTIVFMITALLVLMSILPISAEESKPTITVDEAKALIQMSFDFYNDVRITRTNYLDVNNVVTVPEVVHEGTETERIERRGYCLVIEERLPGGSFEGMCEYAKTIYTDDIAEAAYKYAERKNLPGTVFRNLFYKNDDGKMYARSMKDQPMAPTSFYILVNEGFELELTEGDSEYANANVKVWIYTLREITPYVQITIECSFKNTENGWRIAKSDFSEMMDTDGFKWSGGLDQFAPSTGDPNVSRVWWLAGVSLAALVPAALLVQRRRRRED